ncbi:MAG: hypothetical protein HYX68_14630 [Planctomycetes bacterium]|nr:hypothetical protein [Planctomycetota bacterium]
MRAGVWLLGTISLLALAEPARAQFASALGGTSGLFANTMAKPSFTPAMMSRPMVPPPLSLGSMMPSFPHLQNTMLLRNIFTGPQVKSKFYPMPAPKYKQAKKWWWQKK